MNCSASRFAVLITLAVLDCPSASVAQDRSLTLRVEHAVSPAPNSPSLDSESQATLAPAGKSTEADTPTASRDKNQPPPDNSAEATPPGTPEWTPLAVTKPYRPPIVDAPIVAAGEVKDEVTDNELVLGVVVNGEARAYPINMLTGPSREIINDTLGGTAIAATW